MPELPEVESIRKVLMDRVVGLSIRSVEVLRNDVIKSIKNAPMELPREIDDQGLLVGGSLVDVVRHGKRLAMIVEDGRILEFGLGMSGLIRFEPEPSTGCPGPHEHVSWELETPEGSGAGRLVWKDPRRFGGITPIENLERLNTIHWSHLGPDALGVSEEVFIERIKAGQAPIKARLLNQGVLAGVGNIYADEALYQAGINPRRSAGRTSAARIAELRTRLLEILRQAICAGGSSIRTHRDPEGRSGSYQDAHAVYGRQNEPCRACSQPIRARVLAGRTTHWCPRCQS